MTLLDEVAWWQTDDFWQYALFAATACIRAAASWVGVLSARHARIWPGTLAAQRHKDQFGTQQKQSPDGGQPIISAGQRAVIRSSPHRWLHGSPGYDRAGS